MSTGISGTTTIYTGLSSNVNVGGADIFAGLTGGVNSFVEFDGSISVSKSVEADLKTLTIDKISEMTITGYSAGVSGGINFIV